MSTSLPSLPFLSTDTLTAFESALNGALPGSGTVAANTASNPSVWSNFLGALNGLFPGAAGAATNLANKATGDTTSSGASSISWGRVAAFVVGILLIGGGILMFRQSQVIIQSGIRTGKRVAEVAAL